MKLYKFYIDKNYLTFWAMNDKIATVTTLLVGSGAAVLVDKHDNIVLNKQSNLPSPMLAIHNILNQKVSDFVYQNQSYIRASLKSFSTASVEERTIYDKDTTSRDIKLHSIFPVDTQTQAH
jgi:hypothetical protein